MSVDLIVGPHGQARFAGITVPVAVGRSGFTTDKREGDGATPLGALPCRRLLYRADRLARPRAALTVQPIERDAGWCDDPLDPAYNRPVRLPYRARAERLWRDVASYDVIVPLGWNDDPVETGRGSAIFLHVATGDFAPTEGCVALALTDLLAFLRLADAGSRVVVQG